jgi:hypothetical protein
MRPLAPQAELAELPAARCAGCALAGFEASSSDRLEGAGARAAARSSRLPHRAGGAHRTSCARRRDRRPSWPVERLDDELLLTVDDDGSGADGSAEGSGILGMRERAALLGGSVELAPSPAGRHPGDGPAAVGERPS